MYQKKHQNAEFIRQIIKSNNPLRLQHTLKTTPEFIDIIGKHGLRPIQQAILQGSVNLVQILLDHGADVSVLKPDGSSLLHLAVLNSSIDLVRLLLSYGCAADIADERGETPLFLAVHMNDLKLAKDILQYGADPLKRDGNGCNVFHLAALGDKAHELVTLLCEAVGEKNDLNRAICDSFTSDLTNVTTASPLDTAILTKSVNTLRVFLSFLTPESLNCRCNNLINHCLSTRTKLDVLESIVESGYNYRRELSQINLEDYQEHVENGTLNRYFFDYVKELKARVPCLFLLCRIKLLASLPPRERRSTEALSSLQLPLLLSQKLILKL